MFVPYFILKFHIINYHYPFKPNLFPTKESIQTDSLIQQNNNPQNSQMQSSSSTQLANSSFVQSNSSYSTNTSISSQLTSTSAIYSPSPNLLTSTNYNQYSYQNDSIEECNQPSSSSILSNEFINEKDSSLLTQQYQPDIQSSLLVTSSEELIINNSEQSSSHSNSTAVTTRPNRLIECLSGSREILQQYHDSPVLAVESTIKKSQWTRNLYLPFASFVKINPFPLDTKWVVSFLRFCAFNCHYSYSSIKNIIYRQLIQLHRDAVSDSLPGDITETVRKLFIQIRKDPRTKKEGKGLEPLIASDVSLVIDAMHPDYPEKARIASLFLFALNTGARAITCAGVRICDIIKVTQEDNNCSVIINQKVTKGDANWNHQVTLSGNLKQPHSLNFIYYLNQYLHQKLNLSLEQTVKINAENKIHGRQLNEDSLWGMSPNAMRERLKTYLRKLGYPSREFGFHSLRSGYLCTALLNTNDDLESRTAVLERTAIVAGWVPGGKAQMRYVKKVASRRLNATALTGIQRELNDAMTSLESISNNNQVDDTTAIAVNNDKDSSLSLGDSSCILISDTSDSDDQRPIDATVLNNFPTVEQYHDFQPTLRVNQEREIIAGILNMFRKKITVKEMTHADKMRYFTSCWSYALIHFPTPHQPPIIPPPNHNRPTEFIRQEKKKRARRYIINEVIQHRDRITKIVNQLYRIVQKGGMVRSVISPKLHYKLKPKPILTKAKREYVMRGDRQIRKRIDWNIDENKILISGRSNNMTWFDISRQLANRSAQDCQEHYKNLRRANKLGMFEDE